MWNGIRGFQLLVLFIIVGLGIMDEDKQQTFTNDKHHEDAVKLEFKITATLQDLRQSNDDITANKHNQTIRRAIDKLKSKLETIEQLSRTELREEDRTKFKDMTEWHMAQLKELQNAHRQANLECKKAMDKQQRQDLFSTKDGIRNRKDNRDGLVQTASTITDGLIEARQTLAAQVKRNEEAMHVLVSSSNKIKGTDTEMKNVSAAVNTSHKLITKYGRRDITDKVLISLGLLLFFGTVFYILQKRLLPNFLRWT